jgi:hypothetical protein
VEFEKHKEPEAGYLRGEDAWEFTGTAIWGLPYRVEGVETDYMGNTHTWTDNNREPYNWTLLVTHTEIEVELDKDKGLALLAQRLKELMDQDKERLRRKREALEALRRYKQAASTGGLDEVTLKTLDRVLKDYEESPVSTIENLAGTLKDALDIADDANLLNPTESDILEALEKVNRYVEVYEILKRVKTVATAYDLFVNGPNMSEEELLRKMGEVVKDLGSLAPGIFGQFIEFYGEALNAAGDGVAEIKKRLIENRYLPLASVLTCDQLLQLAEKLHPGSQHLRDQIQRACEVKKLLDKVMDP